MGIRDRDYMKRPSDDDDSREPAPRSKVEAFLVGFFQRHPRFFLYAGISLVVLIVTAFIVVHFSTKRP